MFSQDDDLSNLRFGMTEVPKPGGQPGDYEERLSQWFLERSFFRDFTYRNPQKRKGEEFADAVVLFDDVALLVQVKAQCGNHEAKAWVTEAILKALKQVRATHDSLTSDAIKILTNEVYGKLDFDPARSIPTCTGSLFPPRKLIPSIPMTWFLNSKKQASRCSFSPSRTSGCSPTVSTRLQILSTS